MSVSPQEKSDEIIDIASKLVKLENSLEFDFLFRSFIKKVDAIRDISQVAYFVGRAIQESYIGNRAEALRFSKLVKAHPDTDFVDCMNAANALESCGLVFDAFEMVSEVTPEGLEFTIASQIAFTSTLHGNIETSRNLIEYAKVAYSNQTNSIDFSLITDIELFLKVLGSKAVKLGLVGKAINEFSKKLKISSRYTDFSLTFFNDENGLVCELSFNISEDSISEEQYFKYDDLFTEMIRPAIYELDTDRFLVSLSLK
jgi:hypothetical protein